MNIFWRFADNIQKDAYHVFTLATLSALLLLYFNISLWQSPFLGVVIFVVYVAVNTVWFSQIVRGIFSFSRGWSLIFSNFLLWYMVSMMLAVFVDFFRYTSGYLIVVLLVFTIVARWGGRYMNARKAGKEDHAAAETDGKTVSYYQPKKYLVLLWTPLVVYGSWLLWSARTGDFILSPWGVIPRIYLYVFLVVTFVMAVLIFSKRPVSTLLFAIIIHSFLLHAYLPLVYETGFGGDKWRHIASERYVKTGEIYQPSLIGEVEYADVGGARVPSVLLAGNKTSYGQQWSLTLLISEMLQVDVFWVDVWLLYILWSLFLPLIFYQFAGVVFNNRQFRLLFAFVPALFYPFQVFGALTLPVSLGHLLFFFMLFLWLKYYRDGGWGLLAFNLAVSAFMYVGYVLNFILIGEVALLVLVGRWLKKNNVSPWIKRTSFSILALFFVALIPLLEYWQGFGFLKGGIPDAKQIFSSLADAFGYISGLVAFLPQTGHIDQGNFLFNQTRNDQASVSFLSFRLLPLIFTVLVWAVIYHGFRFVKKLKDRRAAKLLGLFFAIVMGNYILSWYFMEGNHILARRLDQTIVMFMGLFVSLGVFYFLYEKNRIAWPQKVLAVGILLAFIATSTYASGPYLQVVTSDEYRAAQYIWQNIDTSDEYYCVIANTWPLLAVEAESGRAIIGGGFPVGFEYAQPERVKIFEKMSQFPDKKWLNWALDITHDDSCFYMNEDRWINDRVYKETVDLLGEPDKVIGDVYIWRYRR